MNRNRASIPNTFAMMHQVFAEVGQVERYARCLDAMARSGRLRRYDKSTWRRWSGYRASTGFNTTAAALPVGIAA